MISLNIDLKKSYLNCRIVYQISDSEILKEIHSPETKKKLYMVIINNNLLYIYIIINNYLSLSNNSLGFIFDWLIPFALIVHKYKILFKKTFRRKQLHKINF